MFILNFMKQGPGSSVEELPSKGTKYATLEQARAAARQALEMFKYIAYVSVYEVKDSGSEMFVTRIERS